MPPRSHLQCPFVIAVLPSFTKTPMDLTIRAGAMARLECAAGGHPAPQIAWQKDGGTDFPAARERRMHVMPEDDVFFIVDVKIEDIGVYSCTAQNSAGSVSANATLTVLGETGGGFLRLRVPPEGPQLTQRPSMLAAVGGKGADEDPENSVFK